MEKAGRAGGALLALFAHPRSRQILGKRSKPWEPCRGGAAIHHLPAADGERGAGAGRALPCWWQFGGKQGTEECFDWK